MSDAPAVRHPVLASAEIVTVGLPFCVFKLLTGLALFQLEPRSVLGIALVALGALDLGFNLVNLFALVVVRRRAGAVCLTDFVQRRLARPSIPDDLGIAIDVFLSFALVALVVGGGMIRLIPPGLLPLWNAAVVLNVLGAGVGRLMSSFQQRAR